MREKTINVVFFFCSMSGHYEPDHSQLGNYLKVETVTTTQSLPTPSLAMALIGYEIDAWSTGPFARPLAYSVASVTHSLDLHSNSLAPYCMLR